MNDKHFVIMLPFKTITFASFKVFDTYEDALEYANTLTHGVTIYESIARTEIKHEIIEIHENNSSTSGIKN